MKIHFYKIAIRNFLKKFFDRLKGPVDPTGNYPSRRHILDSFSAEYRILSISGPDHNPSFEIEVRINGKAVATGRANKRKIAESKAAKAALEAIQQGGFPHSGTQNNAKEETTAV